MHIYLTWMHIYDCCIATTAAKPNGKCITATSCILQVEIDEIVNIQNPQLVMLQNGSFER